MQLHQHEVADHGLRQVGVFAQGVGHVVEHGEVGEQAAGLEHHAHPAAQEVQGVVAQLVHHLAVHLDVAAGGYGLAADQAQQGGLAAAAGAEQADHAAARNAQVETLEEFAFAVGETQILDIDQGFGGHGGLPAGVNAG